MSSFLTICCFLKCSHIVLGLKCKNFIVRKYIIVILYFHCVCQKKLELKTVDVLYVRGKLGAKILSNLNLVRKACLNSCIAQNFIPMEVNEL